MKLTKEDIQDLRSVVNEQFDLIQRLSKTPLNHVANYRDYQTIYNDVNGPSGGIEKIVERNV
ncbi:MAG: hypothetical protein EB078_09025 [Proteobacteria bacterium]|nr:hypothetical protein [Pseudomonadota bacterium]